MKSAHKKLVAGCAGAVLGLAGSLMACSDDSASTVATPQNEAGALDASGSQNDTGTPITDSSITDSSITDSSTDGGTDGSIVTDAALGCTDAGALAAPAAAHAHIDATIVAGGGYNGTTAAFTGSDLPGDNTATNIGLVNISNWSGTGTGARQVNVLSFTQFTQCATIAVSASSPIRYYEGNPVERGWQCNSGTIQVDTVSGSTVNFHFTAECAPVTLGPGQSATGTITLSGKGVATF